MLLLTKLAAFVVQDGGALVPRNINFLAVWGLLPAKLAVEECRQDSLA
jgi:hypothetical protein